MAQAIDPSKEQCTQCGTAFGCEPAGTCWCMELPAVLPAEAQARCLCPQCLTAAIRQYFETHPEAARPYQTRQGATQKPVQDFVEGRDYYLNEAGNWVFTGYYHLKKGYCCQSGCLHCPYGYKKP